MKLLIIIALLLIPVVAMAEFTGTFALYGGDTITEAKDTSGARFTYSGTDDTVYYSLYGRVWVPNTGGTYPGIITCHGASGGPDLQYNINTVMRGWGAITIAVCLGHASAGQDNLCPGGDCQPSSAADAGAAEENTQRIMKVVDMLANLSALGGGFTSYTVDATRLAIHGHSAGAYTVTRVLTDEPNTFRAASHTGGGYWGYDSECTALDFPADCCTGSGTGTCTGCPLGANYCPRYPSEISGIITPYSLNKGLDDTTVPLIRDQDLERILIDIGTTYELVTYAGLTHSESNQPPDNVPVLANIQTWYDTYNMFTSGNSTTTTVTVSSSTTTVAVSSSTTTTVTQSSTTTTATACGGTLTGATIQ